MSYLAACLVADPATRFVSTGVSYNSIMLSTIISGQKNLLGIDSEGRIVLVRPDKHLTQNVNGVAIMTPYI